MYCQTITFSGIYDRTEERSLQLEFTMKRQTNSLGHRRSSTLQYTTLRPDHKIGVTGRVTESRRLKKGRGLKRTVHEGGGEGGRGKDVQG